MAAPAHNLNGNTLHKTVKLPINSYGHGELNQEQCVEIRRNLKDCLLIILDECFFMGQEQNYFFNVRM